MHARFISDPQFVGIGSKLRTVYSGGSRISNGGGGGAQQKVCACARCLMVGVSLPLFKCPGGSGLLDALSCYLSLILKAGSAMHCAQCVVSLDALCNIQLAHCQGLLQIFISINLNVIDLLVYTFNNKIQEISLSLYA